MRSPATLLSLVLLLAARPLSAWGQETPPPRAPTPADSARTAKADREAARRASKESERVRKEAENAPPAVVALAPLPRSERTTLSVLAFHYGTVTNQSNYGVKAVRGMTLGTVISDPSALAHEDNQNIGAGVAELLKAELTNGHSFRIVELRPSGEAPGAEELPRREPTEPQDSAPVPRRGALRARLLVTGSITRFGTEDHVIGGAGILKKALGGIGLSKKRTVVELTAQVQDAETGEVLLSITGFGMSRKGGGLVAAGGTKDGVVAVGTATNVSSVAIGEATRLAVQDLAAKISNAREVLLSALLPITPTAD